MNQLLSNFQIIRYSDDIIELKSKYHYWCILPNRCSAGTYFLYHKHKLNHSYHRQLINSHSLRFAVKYVLNHDAYVESN